MCRNFFDNIFDSFDEIYKPLNPEDSPFFEQLEETQTLKMHISFLKIWTHDQAHIMKICEIQFWKIHFPKRQKNNFPCQMISICNKFGIWTLRGMNMERKYISEHYAPTF